MSFVLLTRRPFLPVFAQIYSLLRRVATLLPKKTETARRRCLWASERNMDESALANVVGPLLTAINLTLQQQSTDSKVRTEILARQLDNLNTNIVLLADQLASSSEQLDTNITALTKGVERVADRIETILTPEITSSSDQTNETLVRLTGAIERVENVLKTIDTTITAKSFAPETENPTEEEFNIEAAIRRRNLLSEKKIRSETLSCYYEELLNEATPYAQPKFRTKVPKNAPERDLKHRRQQSINNVRTDIEIMKDRIQDWVQQCVELDAQIENYCSSHPNERAVIQAKVQEYEVKYKESYMATFQKMREDDEKNKNETFDFLLNIVDEEAAPSKNDRGRSGSRWNRPNSRNHRGRR